MMRRLFASLIGLLALCSVASAQCNGVFAPGTFCGNSNTTAAPPKPISGSSGNTLTPAITWSGVQSYSAKVYTAAPTTPTAGFQLPPGTAPITPVNGDVWTDSTGLFARIAGITYAFGPAGLANPTGLVSPTATNGTAITAMRSDAAPAINLTANYNWTGTHTFSPTISGGYVNFTQSGSGAVLRTIQGKAQDTVNVKDFGAVCDGNTDDGTAIRNAVAAATGGTVIFPNATCAIGKDGANAWALRINNNVSLTGFGPASTLKPLAAVTNITDVVYVDPDPTYVWDNWSITNLFIGDQTTAARNGRDGIRIDTQTAGHILRNPRFSKLSITHASSGAGVCINHVNNAGVNTTGGMSLAAISNVICDGGYSFNSTGDTINIVGGIVTGPNAVYVNQISGASTFNITNTNISSAGGIVFDCAVKPSIIQTEVEQNVTNTESNNSMLDLRGSICQIVDAAVQNSRFTPLAGTGSPLALRIGNASGTKVSGNTFSSPTDYSPVRITATTSGTVINANNTINVGGAATSAVVSDSSGGGTTWNTNIAYQNAGFGLLYASGGPGITVTAVPTNGQFLVGRTGLAPNLVAMSGVVTMTGAGVTGFPSSTGSGAVVLATAPTISTATLSGTTTISGTTTVSGSFTFNQAFSISGVVYASRPATPTTAGAIAYITDATSNGWGTPIIGGGTNKVLTFYNGSAWTVFGK